MLEAILRQRLALFATTALLATLAFAGWQPEERLTERPYEPDQTSLNNAKCIASDRSGDLHAVWFGPNGATNQVWYSRRNALSGSWSTDIVISIGNGKASYPAIAVDDSDNVHVVWRFLAQDTAIHYRCMSSTGEWGRIETVAIGNTAEFPSVATVRSGFVAVAWQQVSPLVYYNVFAAVRDSSGWRQPETVSVPYHGSQGRPSVGVTVDDRIQVAWQNSSSRLILFRERTPIGWGYPETVFTARPCSVPNVATGRSGTAHVLWMANLPGLGDRLVYRQRLRGTWSDTCVLPLKAASPGPGSIGIDEAGYLHGVWAEGVNALLASSSDSTGHAWCVPESATTPAARPSLASISCGPGANLRVIWTDARGIPNSPDIYCSRYVSGQDIGVMRIESPVGSVDSGARVIRAAWLRNTGDSIVRSLQVWFRIGSLLDSAVLASLGPNDSARVTFDSITITGRSWCATACSTALSGDINHSNDVLRDSFFVCVRDVALDSILWPVGRTPRDTVYPRARIRNLGNLTASCSTQFSIWQDMTRLYTSTVVESVPPGETGDVTFEPWPGRVGTFIGVCRTWCVGDMHPENDADSVQFTVFWRDIAAENIIWPPAVIDSGDAGNPALRVLNLGSEPETLRAVFRVGPDYRESVVLADFLPGADTVLEFAQWTASTRGTQALACTASCTGDLNNLNDTLTGSVFTRVMDVSLDRIILPAETLQVESLAIRARLTNRGNVAALCSTRLEVRRDSSLVHSDNQDSVLSPGESLEVQFSTWLPDPGSYVAACSAACIGDRHPENDTASASFVVYQPDVSIKNILWPGAVVDSGATGRPRVTVVNNGLEPEDFTCRFSIGTSYADTVVDHLGPGEEKMLEFSEWQALLRGNHAILCTIPETGSRLRGTMFVRVCDVAADSVLWPIGRINPGPQVPEARFSNPGNEPEDALCFFSIRTSGSTVYRDSCSVTLQPGTVSITSFDTSYMTYGSYVSACSVFVAGDMRRMNDTASAPVVVETLVGSGWRQLASMPTGPQGAPARDGAALVALNPGLLALKGCGTPEWYRYDAGADNWSALAAVSVGPSGRKVKAGATACTDGAGRVFVVKGNRTRELLEYSVSEDSWAFLPGIPAGTHPLRYSAGLAYVGTDTGHLYLVKASGTNDFLVHWLKLGQWHARRPVPGKKLRHGTGLVAVSKRVFCLKGGTNELAEYFAKGDSWSERSPMPRQSASGRTRKARKGACLAADGSRYIYAFKGGWTCEFWRYDVVADTWVQLEDIPSGDCHRKVGRGGALAVWNSGVYALKAGGCCELWCYVPPTGTAGPKRLAKTGGQDAARTGLVKTRSAVVILDILGRRVKSADRRRPGVYFALDPANGRTVKSVVVR